MMDDRGHLVTEQANPASAQLDTLSIAEFVALCQQEDLKAVQAVIAQQASIEQAIARIAEKLASGGRLFYVGAGTSGRLGVLDSAECPPTFCTDPDLVQAILAGGLSAMVKSSEALEDSWQDGAQSIHQRGITAQDVALGITAGGTTPFVHGALHTAQTLGAVTIFLTCVPPEQVPSTYDLDIRPIVGPEILAGSTRLKAGTATKLVLNTISTGVMVQLGKVYGNRMVDVAVTNRKLLDRALRILTDLTGCDRATALKVLGEADNHTKTALFMLWTGADKATAVQKLREAKGNLRQALAGWPLHGSSAQNV
jgi:N-acetylmuramic acid 6-phosphate etherase